MDAYPPSRCGISDLYYIHDRSTRTPPIATIQLYDADCKTMPDFSAVKELVEQHVDSYRYSRASLVQALAIRSSLLELQALLG